MPVYKEHHCRDNIVGGYINLNACHELHARNEVCDVLQNQFDRNLQHYHENFGEFYDDRISYREVVEQPCCIIS